MLKQEASVWIISGPSGVGKGTVCAALLRRHPELFLSVSMTTRDPRPGEVDGVSYHFVSPERFEQLVADGAFLEHACFGRNRYGTPVAPVTEALDEGRNVILEIDLQGARQVKQNMPEAQLVFLKPPSWNDLVARLAGRGTEDAADQRSRLETAQHELAAASEADHFVENDEVEKAVDALVGLMSL